MKQNARAAEFGWIVGKARTWRGEKPKDTSGSESQRRNFKKNS